MSSKRKKNRSKAKNKFHHRYRKADRSKAPPQWENDISKAERGEISESERAEIAAKESLLKALTHFTQRLTKNFDRFNTNLGLVLETRTSVAGSLVIYGTGDNGANEFVPVVLTVNMGVPQTAKEHSEFLLSGAWHELTLPVKNEPEITLFKPEQAEELSSMEV